MTLSVAPLPCGIIEHVLTIYQTLRQIFHHGTYRHPKLHKRLDIQPDMHIWASGPGRSKGTQDRPSLSARSRPERIHRLVDRRMSVIEPQIAAAREDGQPQILDASAWSLDEISGPNVTDKGTILSLAKMTLDAYTLEPFSSEWKDVKGGFNYSDSFGWDADGLRGHVFADKDNSTIVIAIKGTTTGKPAVKCVLLSPIKLTAWQRYTMAQERLRMTRSMIICSLAVAVHSKGVFSGGRCATADQVHSNAIRHVCEQR